MNTIRELKQKGQELASRIAKFGAPLGNKNAAGPHDGRSKVQGIRSRFLKEKKPMSLKEAHKHFQKYSPNSPYKKESVRGRIIDGRKYWVNDESGEIVPRK